MAINASSAGNPLHFIIAGPMEVPYRALQKADHSRLQYVYCISHSRWNDGFASQYKFSFTKRSVIEQDVPWIQIPDQNRLLSIGRYGTPAQPAEFAPYFWMRDSGDPRQSVKFPGQAPGATTSRPVAGEQLDDPSAVPAA